MADEIILKYKIDTSDFEKVETAVEDVTTKTKKLGTEIKAAYSGKEIDEAVKKLHEQGDTMEALIVRYGDAGKALKAMQKELQTMAALGQTGTKEFKELTKATAQLSDTIGDTRGHIKKLASDTRVFDLMVQGARGITAAFSVATGVTAVFGKESEDLQKAILKVQGAMAALQGVQELANIATEKGGIATKIASGYQAAYTAVVGTSTGAMKAFRLALAATGIGLAIVGIALLVEHWETLNNKVREFLGLEKEIDTAKQGAEATDRYKRIAQGYNDEIELAKSKGEEIKQLELQRLNDRLGILNEFYEQNKTDLKFTQFYFEEKQNITVKQNELMRQLEEERLKKFGELQKKQIAEMRETDAILAQVLFDTANRLDLFKNEYLKSGEEIDEPLVSPETVDENKANVDKMAADYAAALAKAVQDNQMATEQRIRIEQIYWTAASDMALQASSAINSIVNGFSNQQLEQSQFNKEKELELAGDNANKKKIIEQKYAIEQAKIKRQQAIAEKAFSLFDIAITTARAISAAVAADAAVPAILPPGIPNPAKAASVAGMTAAIALASVTAALRTASVAAQPLPGIPKFAKGGQVLAGGRSKDGHLIGRSHRQGGILIEAEGGEYIWDKQTTAKHGEIIKAAHEKRLDDLILHRYVAPAMKSEADKQAQKAYDDYMLRQTIKQGHGKDKQNAEYIVRGVSQSVSELVNNSNRYR